MKTLIAILIVGFAAVSAGVIYYLQHPPAPFKRIINPTHFDSPQVLGEAMARRLYVDIRDKGDLFVFGLSESIPSGAAVWAAFQAELSNLGLRFEKQKTIQAVREIGAPQGKTALFAPSTDEFRREVLPLGTVNFWVAKYSHLRSDQKPDRPECNLRQDVVSFDCLAQRVQNSFYRRRLEKPEYSAMLEEVSPREYVLYIYDPKGN